MSCRPMWLLISLQSTESSQRRDLKTTCPCCQCDPVASCYHDFVCYPRHNKPIESHIHVNQTLNQARREFNTSLLMTDCVIHILIAVTSLLICCQELTAQAHFTDEHQKKTMATMKAAMFDEHGGPEKLYIGEVQRPKPGRGQVLLKVFATALNRADTLQLAGRYDPPPGSSPILGLEAAGEVIELGAGCSVWKLGDRVAALLDGGGYAEYVVAYEGHLMPVLSHMTLESAAGIPEVWLTAYQLLHFVGHVKKGDRVLIHAGGSGVGTAAIQLVRLAGAEAVVTAGTAAKLDMARDLGAVAGFNYKEVDFADKVLEYTENKGVDMILDCVGASYWEKNLRAISVDGTWVLYGLMGGANVEGAILGGVLRKRVTLVGTTLRARSVQYKADLVRAFTANALPHFEDRLLKPITDKVFSLEEIVDAHKHMAANRNIGKIIVSVLKDRPGTSHREL